MKTLIYQLKELCKNKREDSFATRKKRSQVLKLAAEQLSKELGYPHMEAQSLKPKHVNALVEHWKSQSLSAATIKSRMAHLRWWARKINKPNVIARSNDHYGIERRVYKPTESKACDVTKEQLSLIKDDLVKSSVRLSKAFGLRKEESIKFNPTFADKGDHIELKATWCKGGKKRTVPIITKEQRELLDEVKALVKNASLIPPNLQYFQQRNRHEKATAKAGLSNLHGLRHRYAQQRYKVLTGFNCPLHGGPNNRQMTHEQMRLDKEARLIVSQELGHQRISIVTNYIG
jgi:hypothetical protein